MMQSYKARAKNLLTWHYYLTLFSVFFLMLNSSLSYAQQAINTLNTSVPVVSSDVIIEMATGAFHSLALMNNGKVYGWGGNQLGQADVPANLPPIKAIAAGDLHSLALTNEGQVIGWGDNRSGQSNPPEDLDNVVAIAAASYTSVALKQDGTVVVWGNTRAGQDDIPEGLNNVVKIAIGGFHVLALRADGTVIAWGSNKKDRASVPENLTDVYSIDSGLWHNIALKKDGSVVTWGSNRYGRLDAPTMGPVARVYANLYVSAAILAHGELVVWGNERYGTDRMPINLLNVRLLSLGELHGFAVANDHTVYAWGINTEGQLDVPLEVSNNITIVPTQFEHRPTALENAADRSSKTSN